jgi:hypothetical protein
MRREPHVRSCESGRVRFPPATHQNRKHGLIGGRWGGTTDANRDGRETFGPALDVGVTDYQASGLPHRFWPKGHL